MKKGGTLLVALAVVALVAPLAAPYAPDAIELASYLPLTESPRPPQSTDQTFR